MNSFFDSMKEQARNDGVILDTNLLLLFVVGLVDPKRIPTFKRTKKFNETHFSRIYYFVHQYPKIITTPHILTEVSDLLEGIGNDKNIFHTVFQIYYFQYDRSI